MIEERFESYVYQIMQYVKYQENKPYIESILEDMKYTLFREDREYIKDLQQENKQLKDKINNALNYIKWHYDLGTKEDVSFCLLRDRLLEILGDKK